MSFDELIQLATQNQSRNLLSYRGMDSSFESQHVAMAEVCARLPRDHADRDNISKGILGKTHAASYASFW